MKLNQRENPTVNCQPVIYLKKNNNNKLVFSQPIIPGKCLQQKYLWQRGKDSTRKYLEWKRAKHFHRARQTVATASGQEARNFSQPQESKTSVCGHSGPKVGLGPLAPRWPS